MRPLPQRRLPQLVAPGVRLPVAAQVEPLPHVPVHAPGQRLAALPAGATCIPADANAPAQPLSPRDWEELLGHVPGASSGLPPSAALAALRSAPPPLALSAVLAAAVVLQRHYLTPHDTHTPPPQVLAPADAGPVLPLGGSDDAEDTELARILTQDVVWGPETWGPEQQLALDTVKAEFAREGLILRAYDPSRPLILHTDWCEDGVSGVLGQLDDDAREYMVACVSRTCNVHERRYGSYKGELLAAVWAIQTLRPYLHATPFTLVTDHAPLEWLMSQPELTGQAARWAMILQQYSFSVGTAQPELVAVTTLARAGMRTVLPPFAAALCSATTTPAVLLLHPAQPWAPASRLQFACLQATLTPAGDTTVPSPGELLHDEDDEHALRTAALIVVQQSRALRALSPAPRLRLRTSALHGSVVGVSTFLRQHALIFAAETDAISVLEVPGGLAPGLQACLRLGWRIRRYCNLDSSGTVREALSGLLPHLARLHPDLLPPPTPAAPAREDQPRGSATPAINGGTEASPGQQVLHTRGQWAK
ncbi:hypothetical protein CHLRE_09g404503v5 [Chlamydomonas reinhardtii]|nr:uncharacterized protein CHLRE_09g404503v5 [Chlamydomonas reinhardtii]PNW78265.1 hypothetical protein CHLRE_09g404503v5 [Chlamydomonas reinhardtii]